MPLDPVWRIIQLLDQRRILGMRTGVGGADRPTRVRRVECGGRMERFKVVVLHMEWRVGYRARRCATIAPPGACPCWCSRRSGRRVSASRARDRCQRLPDRAVRPSTTTGVYLHMAAAVVEDGRDAAGDWPEVRQGAALLRRRPGPVDTDGVGRAAARGGDPE